MAQQKENFFSLVCKKRYYHFVAFQFNRNYSIRHYWTECGETKGHHFFENDDTRIEYCNIILNDSFYGGQKEDFSLNGDGQKPYHYDLFAIHIKALNIYLFGFPFQTLARSVIDRFIKNNFASAKVVKVNLKQLVKAENLNDENESHSARFSGVEIKLSNDANITSVNLDGDKPLESAIYTTFFKNQLDDPKTGCTVEKSSIRFDLLNKSIPSTAANIYLDLFGNYKLYMHSSSHTVFNLPYFFLMLNSFNTLIPIDSVTNPISRIKNE